MKAIELFNELKKLFEENEAYKDYILTNDVSHDKDWASITTIEKPTLSSPDFTHNLRIMFKVPKTKTNNKVKADNIFKCSNCNEELEILDHFCDNRCSEEWIRKQNQKEG